MKTNIKVIAYRKKVNVIELIISYFFALLGIAVFVFIPFPAYKEFYITSSFYLILLISILLCGLFCLLLVDTILLNIRAYKNNKMTEECVYFDESKNSFIVYSLKGIYEIPKQYIYSFKGHGFLGRNALSILYYNKHHRIKSLLVGYAIHIKDLRREYKRRRK